MTNYISTDSSLVSCTSCKADPFRIRNLENKSAEIELLRRGYKRTFRELECLDCFDWFGREIDRESEYRTIVQNFSCPNCNKFLLKHRHCKDADFQCFQFKYFFQLVIAIDRLKPVPNNIGHINKYCNNLANTDEGYDTN